MSESGPSSAHDADANSARHVAAMTLRHAVTYASRRVAPALNFIRHPFSVSIRKTLLVAFVSVGVVSALALASLAFFKARQAVRAEIERSLDVQAKGVSAEI